MKSIFATLLAAASAAASHSLRYMDPKHSKFTLCRVAETHTSFDECGPTYGMSEFIAEKFAEDYPKMVAGTDQYEDFNTKDLLTEYGLTEEEVKPIYTYSYSFDKQSFFRSFSIALSKGHTGNYECATEFLTKAMESIPSAEEDMTYRCDKYLTKTDEFYKKLMDKIRGLKVGDVIVTNSFTSSSTKELLAIDSYAGVTDAEKLLWRIHRPTAETINGGCHYIAPFCRKPSEYECLYQPGVQFKVTKTIYEYEYEKDGETETINAIDLEQITEGFPQFWEFKDSCPPDDDAIDDSSSDPESGTDPEPGTDSEPSADSATFATFGAVLLGVAALAATFF